VVHLLAAGADVGAQDHWRQTALHLAAEHGHDKVVELLLAAGTDFNTQDQDWRTALHRAAEHGHDKVVELLLAAGADFSTQDEDGCTAPYPHPGERLDNQFDMLAGKIRMEANEKETQVCLLTLSLTP
jgi:ankyrin repeat protein